MNQGSELCINVLPCEEAMKYLLCIALITAIFLPALGTEDAAAEHGQSGAQTRIINDNVPVYPRMAVGGSIVHKLSSGDTVTVQFELERASRIWCSIIHQGEATVIGYVECRHLERQEHPQWERLDSTPPSRGTSVSYMNTTEVRVVSSQVLVPVILNNGGSDVPVQMLLDTGSSGTVIKSEVARRMGLDLDNAVTVKAMVVGGGTIEVKVVQLTRMTVGPHQVADPVIGVFEHFGRPVSFDGILGMDFLGEVDYQLDLDRKVITWTK